MCIRLAPVRAHHLHFDEKLPLYGWYEDVDFSRQLARFGTVMQMPEALGVHLGSKNGRTSGVRLGYSQISNPIYLFQKGTFPWSHMIYSITVRFLKNIVMSLRSEPYIDRRGRLRGNLLGLRDLLVGKLDPARILIL
jgi:GT2 family glycosyltransferase